MTEEAVRTLHSLAYVINRIYGTHFDERKSVYALVEVLKHPGFYPHIYDHLFLATAILDDYQTDYSERTGKNRSDVPPVDAEEAWICLLSEDAEWLKKAEAAPERMSSVYFDNLLDYFTNPLEDEFGGGLSSIDFVGGRLFPKGTLAEDDERLFIAFENDAWLPINVIYAHCDNLRELYEAFTAVDAEGAIINQVENEEKTK